MGNCNEPGSVSKLLTPTQVAEILSVTPAWVRDHVGRRAPRLPSIRVGKLIRFDPCDVQRFVDEMRSGRLAA